MKKIWRFILTNQNLIYKGFLMVVCSFLIVYLFPKGAKFKYEFQKGKPWQYATLYAPFDFSILKSPAELEAEKQAILDSQFPYYRADMTVYEAVNNSYASQFSNFFNLPVSNKEYKDLYDLGLSLLEETYTNGVLPPGFEQKGGSTVFLIKGNVEFTVDKDQFIRIETLQEHLDLRLEKTAYTNYSASYYKLFFEIVLPNITLDEKFTFNSINQSLSDISPYRGLIQENSVIIKQGEVVEGEKFQMLMSLRDEIESQLWNELSYYWIIFGYTILVVLTFMSLILFIYNYRPSIFQDNREITFIFLNMVGMISLMTIVVNLDVRFLYAVPICILPLILKTFFDPRLGLFTHVITVLNLGFVVPNSFEFVFLQMMVGIVTTLSITQLQNRANLFITVGRIVLVYLVCYIGFTITREGGIGKIDFLVIGLFLLNGLLTLFAQPLIYLFERLFKLVSDVSLLEFSDTNSKLLKELSDRAPGTFHHSLQVANLAETAANEIGANNLLVRVGALYHDIGKMNAPTYFSENQTGSVSPHEEMPPDQSAKIIINHVADGIELAKKFKLPDRVIDFIRTHHGNSWVYFFLKKAQEYGEDVDEKYFRYPGPRPFSKETAILMMADAVEAASKSLREPTVDKIHQFVQSIVNKQIDEKQFNDCNITLSEIETVKKVLSKKLINVYNLRVEYPE
ncbi:MAG: HDIG domain-containing metalloprotein [Bacteroidota bacterium]|nr:HDIG domain-containing metalloprotein [Bacteroidota bacterium]